MKLLKNITLITALLLLTPASFAYDYIIKNTSGKLIVDQNNNTIENVSYTIRSYFDYMNGKSWIFSTNDGRVCAFYLYDDPKKNEAFAIMGSAKCTVSGEGKLFTFDK